MDLNEFTKLNIVDKISALNNLLKDKITFDKKQNKNEPNIEDLMEMMGMKK